ncbi:MAG: methyl-accepting chemotaxis protein [Calditrichia bacterium]
MESREVANLTHEINFIKNTLIIAFKNKTDVELTESELRNSILFDLVENVIENNLFNHHYNFYLLKSDTLIPLFSTRRNIILKRVNITSEDEIIELGSVLPAEQVVLNRQIKIKIPLADRMGNIVLEVLPKKIVQSDSQMHFLIILVGEFAIFILSFIVAGLFRKRILNLSDRINDVLYKINEGDYSGRLELSTITDIKRIESNVNLLLEKISFFRESFDEKQRIKDKITKLLNVVNRSADGDFTVFADVSDDLLGYLADSFNLMIGELSKLILDVKNASDQIAQFTGTVLNNTEQIAQGAKIQAQKISDNSHATIEMTKQIEKAFHNAQIAQNSILKATEASRNGTVVVYKAIEQMHKMREKVTEAARKVKMLKENSSEIAEIIEVIEEISSRTNVLALNATIEASRAGQFGKGFSLIADEIRDLADKVKHAAFDVQSLLSNIQKGTNQTIEAIESGSEQIKLGTGFADKAGKTFNDILEMINQVSILIQEMVISLEVQAKKSNEIAAAISDIAKISDSAAKNTSETAHLSAQMQSLSHNLIKAVSKFKLRD